MMLLELGGWSTQLYSYQLMQNFANGVGSGQWLRGWGGGRTVSAAVRKSDGLIV